MPALVPLNETLTAKWSCKEEIKHSADHCHRVGYLEDSFEHKIRHEAMQTLQLGKGLGCGVGGDEHLEDGGGKAMCREM
jgi:hypothetical protein